MKTIFVVDDSINARELIIEYCKTIDDEVSFLEAENGQEALSNIKKSDKKIDLIICDQNMPEMNGVELLGHLRQIEDCSEIPFVLVTSEGDEDLIVEALSSGADDFLTKPIDEEKFINKIVKILR